MKCQICDKKTEKNFLSVINKDLILCETCKKQEQEHLKLLKIKDNLLVKILNASATEILKYNEILK